MSWARWNASRRRRFVERRLYLRIFDALGTLYGSGWDEAETLRIREACAAVGLPMGYGRVGRQPEQLWGFEGPQHRKGADEHDD